MVDPIDTRPTAGPWTYKLVDGRYLIYPKDGPPVAMVSTNYRGSVQLENAKLLAKAWKKEEEE